MLQPSELLFCENDSPQDSRTSHIEDKVRREQIRPETGVYCLHRLGTQTRSPKSHESATHYLKSIEAPWNHNWTWGCHLRLKILPPTLFQWWEWYFRQTHEPKSINACSKSWLSPPLIATSWTKRGKIGGALLFGDGHFDADVPGSSKICIE